MKNKYVTLLLSLGLFFLASASTSARANLITIDFESFEHSGAGLVSFPSAFVTQGIQFSGNLVGNDYAVYGSNSSNYTGSTALTPFNNETHTMSILDGSLFDLLSWDISKEFMDDNAISFDVVGNFALGGSITQSVSTNNTFGYQNISFAGFVGLSSVVFTTSPDNFQLDNIVLKVSKVNAPSALVVFVFGLIGIGWTKRKKND